MSRSTSKDGLYLSLWMSGCMCLLQGSPIDTRCTGLPILAWICLVSEERESSFPLLQFCFPYFSDSWSTVF